MSIEYEAFIVDETSCQKELDRIHCSDMWRDEKWENVYDLIATLNDPIEMGGWHIHACLEHFRETRKLLPEPLRGEAERLLAPFPNSRYALPELQPESLEETHPLFANIGFSGCFLSAEQVIALRELADVPDEIESFFAQRHQSRLSRVAYPVELFRAWCLILEAASVAGKAVFALQS